MTSGGAPVDVTGATLRSVPLPPPRAPGPTVPDPGAPGNANTVIVGRAAEPAEVAELEPGTEITRYRIVARLGAGGMGVVYRAHDAQLDRDVALKLLRLDEGGTDGRNRMLREAQAAAKIRHPNVVTVYDAGVLHDRVFIAMELIDGVTLKSHFRGRARAWREVVAVMLGAGEGLAAAHEVGLVHRDFKPDNVLVERGGRVRVLDFGLARPAYDVEGPTVRASSVSGSGHGPGSGAEAPVLRTLTQTGMVVGTPAYMAPEQHLGRGIDARTDQFSFCVTLFECLFRSRPFAGDTQSELTLNVVEGHLQLPADRGDVPQELIALLQRGLAVEPGHRYPSLADLLVDLRAIVRKHEPRDRRGLIAAAVALVIGGSALGLALDHEADASEPPRPPADKKPAPADPPANQPTAPPPKQAAKQPTAAGAGVKVGEGGGDAGAKAGLLGQVLPEGTVAEAGDAGILLAGPQASLWKDAGRMLVLELERRPEKATGRLFGQVPTPSGLWVMYSVADAGERAAALAKVAGVTAVATSDALQVVMVLGSQQAQQAVVKTLQEAKAPKVREWCVRIHNEAGLGGKEECHKTRQLCEEDADEWLGKDRRTGCYAKK